MVLSVRKLRLSVRNIFKKTEEKVLDKILSVK
jgi:hypothetical protein